MRMKRDGEEDWKSDNWSIYKKGSHVMGAS